LAFVRLQPVLPPLAADADKDLTYRGLILKGKRRHQQRRVRPAAVDYYGPRQGTQSARFRGLPVPFQGLFVSLYKIDYNTLNKEFDSPPQHGQLRQEGHPLHRFPPPPWKGIDSIYYPVGPVGGEPGTHPAPPAGYGLDPGRVENCFRTGIPLQDGKSHGGRRGAPGPGPAAKPSKACSAPSTWTGTTASTRSAARTYAPPLDAALHGSARLQEQMQGGRQQRSRRVRELQEALTRSIDINDLNTKGNVRARAPVSPAIPNDINAFPGQNAGAHRRLELQPGFRDPGP